MRNDPDLARLYHLNSSNVRAKLTDLSVDDDRHPFRFRTYPGSDRIALPIPEEQLSMSLGDALKRRRSVRDYVLKDLKLSTLSDILYYAYGVMGYRTIEGEWTCSRPSPSAGGLYPLELYVATQQVTGLSDGIYHYDARAHELETRRLAPVHAELADMTIGQDMIRTANVVFVMTAIFERTMWKYGQRGYRHVFLDAGHLGQNLYLIATAMRLGPVAIGGFFDGELNKLLDLPDEEEVIYLVCVGQPA